MKEIEIEIEMDWTGERRESVEMGLASGLRMVLYERDEESENENESVIDLAKVGDRATCCGLVRGWGCTSLDRDEERIVGGA